MPGYVPVDTPPGTAPLPLGTAVPAKAGGGPPKPSTPGEPGSKRFGKKSPKPPKRKTSKARAVAGRR